MIYIKLCQAEKLQALHNWERGKECDFLVHKTPLD